MYQLTHNGQPVGKPHPHKMAAYVEAVEAVERKLAKVKGRHNSEIAMNQLLETLK
jgi:hypothetical protein